MTAFGWIYNISIIYRDYGQFYFVFVFLMQELETLLTSLIKRGRKPWGKYNKVLDVSRDKNWLMRILKSSNEWMYVDIRSIVSLESGLWQFVCKNNLYKKEISNFRENVSKVWINIWWFAHNYEYRLLESALIPEEELAKFLIENIVMEWLKSEQSKK